MPKIKTYSQKNSAKKKSSKHITRKKSKKNSRRRLSKKDKHSNRPKRIECVLKNLDAVKNVLTKKQREDENYHSGKIMAAEYIMNNLNSENEFRKLILEQAEYSEMAFNIAKNNFQDIASNQCEVIGILEDGEYIFLEGHSEDESFVIEGGFLIRTPELLLSEDELYEVDSILG